MFLGAVFKTETEVKENKKEITITLSLPCHYPSFAICLISKAHLQHQQKRERSKMSHSRTELVSWQREKNQSALFSELTRVQKPHIHANYDVKVV